MPEGIDQVCRSVLKKITPTRQERYKIETLAGKLERKVAAAAKMAGLKAKVRLEGSVSKDTWIGEEPDIDIFMRVSTSIPRQSLGDVSLSIARKATEGSKQIERFAEHPYLEVFVENTRINIVPCYNTTLGEWHSATDRTPFHTDYIKKNLNMKNRGEVRLLKKFIKSIGVYGAEIKTGGFSGYLCELLVLRYESFLKTLQAFARSKQGIVIDIEGHYKSREDEVPLLFNEPLVVIDPVDKSRNVASAVQAQKLCTFIAAAQAFLRTPSRRFFCPKDTIPKTWKKVEQELRVRGSDMIFVVFRGVDVVPDILWGQLHKSQRSLSKLIQLNDFTILRDAVWSDEHGLHVFIFEVERRAISPIKKHLGPPLDKEGECWKFLKKHNNKVRTVCGPYVENGRWNVILKRECSDVVELLNCRLKEGGRTAGVAGHVSNALCKQFKILVNEEILGDYSENVQFAVFLTEFLDGRPKWLEAKED